MTPAALTGECHRRRRALVTPGTVITPQSASADGRLLPGRAQQAGGDGSTRNGALRRLRRRDAIAEGANRVSPPDAAGPVTADPHARIVHSPGEPVRPPSRTADAPGPPARTVGQQPGGTIDLRTRDAPPYRCGQLQLAPVWRAARGTSDLCRVIGGWRAEYPDRHRQRSDRYRLAVRAERRISHVGNIPSVTTRNRDSRHRAVRNARLRRLRRPPIRTQAGWRK